jgi:hypothetical protein
LGERESGVCGGDSAEVVDLAEVVIEVTVEM